MADKPTVPRLTRDEFELISKLEGIFMPHARKQRDELYARHNKPGTPVDKAVLRFVHYTSADAALKIIQSKRLWMRNAMCMADFREVQHGFDIFHRFFSDQTKRNNLVSALDESAHGAAAEAIRSFDRYWNSIRFDTYITSMSEHDEGEDRHGRLSMWRAFGSSAARVALVFNIPWLSGVSDALKILFGPVAYLKEDQVVLSLGEVVENVRANREFLRRQGHQVIVDWVFTMLLTGVTCLKHEGFREEREWRAIYSPKRHISEILEATTEVVGGIPQLLHKIPLDSTRSALLADIEFSQMFDRLIVGPSQYSWPMYEALVEALSCAGVRDANTKVCISGIPIRT